MEVRAALEETPERRARRAIAEGRQGAGSGRFPSRAGLSLVPRAPLQLAPRYNTTPRARGKAGAGLRLPRRPAPACDGRASRPPWFLRFRRPGFALLVAPARSKRPVLKAHWGSPSCLARALRPFQNAAGCAAKAAGRFGDLDLAAAAARAGDVSERR